MFELASKLRIVLVTLLTTAVLSPSVFQPCLTNLWDYLRHATVYNWSTFETIWTVFCYAAIEVPITIVFMNHPEWRFTRNGSVTSKPETTSASRRAKGMRRPSRRLKEAMTYVTPLLLMDLTMIKKFAGVSLESMLVSGNYDPSVLATPAFGRHHSTFLVPTVHNMTLSSPLQTRRALPAEAPTSRRITFELISSLVLYDAIFFLFHLSLHTLPFLRRIHIPHHRHGEIHPQVTNQLHVFERLGLVLLANFSLNIIGSHVLTRTLFIPIFVWLLVEIHSGLDLPWAYDKILPRGWGNGAKRHMLHHSQGEGTLAPYFTWCDRMWGSLRS